ncbi:hypothetical protein CONCODRAFT_32857, partial [Conidiobolus coronatus NRRL 28638]
LCSKQFKRKNSLLRHSRVHSGVKPYSCFHCDKSFSRKDILDGHKQSKKHERIHSGLRPYSCTICNKNFGRKDVLEGH